MMNGRLALRVALAHSAHSCGSRPLQQLQLQLPSLGKHLFVPRAHLSRDAKSGRRLVRGGGKGGKRRDAAAIVEASEPIDPWVEVKDDNGAIYYWNTNTDETTAIGEPKPVGMTAVPPPVPPGPAGVMGSGGGGGLGRVVAEGFAFGVGSSVAHGLVGSMFSGGGDSGGDSGEGGDDESFDI
jgi:hypothetical protein